MDAWAPQREQVRRAMAVSGLTQAEVARRIGVDPNHVNRMISGKIDGPLASWVAVADALGMTWQLALAIPGEPQLTQWVQENLGIKLEGWQATRLRSLVRGH